MSEDNIPVLQPPEGDGHIALIPVQNYHFNVVDIVKKAAQAFQEQTGKEAKYLYAPEAFLYLLDVSVKTRLVSTGQTIPIGAAVVNVHGLDLYPVPGSCLTVTAEPLHDTIPALASTTVQ